MKADYIYSIEGNGLMIEDLNLGRMSVTNCIEDVVDEICKEQSLDPNKLMIVYKDSQRIWDAWDHATQDFILLNENGGVNALRTLYYKLGKNLNQ